MQMHIPNSLRGWLRLLWYAAILTVIVGSLLPGDSLPMRELDQLHASDKVLHCGAYATLAFLPVLTEKRRRLFLVLLGLVSLGILLEFAQLLSVERTFEIGDMVADTAGICAGVALGLPLRNGLK
jgi:VanZ family protein